MDSAVGTDENLSYANGAGPVVITMVIFFFALLLILTQSLSYITLVSTILVVVVQAVTILNLQQVEERRLEAEEIGFDVNNQPRRLRRNNVLVVRMISRLWN